MHLPKVLKSIYQEHGCDFQRLVATLINLDVPLEDVALLSQMPWQLPANRIAVERARLGLPPVHPLLHWKLPPPPPDWLTPAVIVKMFQLALDGPGEPPPGADEQDQEEDDVTGARLVLPA